MIYTSKHTQSYFAKILQCLSHDKADNNIWPPHISDWIKLSDISQTVCMGIISEKNSTIMNVINFYYKYSKSN